MINTMQYSVVKSFIQWQLATKFCGTSLYQVSFLANLLTIRIACLVSPHLMYHMFNLYRWLPFQSPVLVSETALGFCRATLSRPEGGIHGFTGHLNKLLVPVYGQCPPRRTQGCVACCRHTLHVKNIIALPYPSFSS
jgi:hypothetical protein